MQLLTKPCKARVNTIPLQQRRAERSAEQRIANATARRQRHPQFALQTVAHRNQQNCITFCTAGTHMNCQQRCLSP